MVDCVGYVDGIPPSSTDGEEVVWYENQKVLVTARIENPNPSSIYLVLYKNAEQSQREVTVASFTQEASSEFILDRQIKVTNKKLKIVFELVEQTPTTRVTLLRTPGIFVLTERSYFANKKTKTSNPTTSNHSNGTTTTKTHQSIVSTPAKKYSPGAVPYTIPAHLLGSGQPKESTPSPQTGNSSSPTQSPSMDSMTYGSQFIQQQANLQYIPQPQPQQPITYTNPSSPSSTSSTPSSSGKLGGLLNLSPEKADELFKICSLIFYHDIANTMPETAWIKPNIGVEGTQVSIGFNFNNNQSGAQECMGNIQIFFESGSNLPIEIIEPTGLQLSLDFGFVTFSIPRYNGGELIRRVKLYNKKKMQHFYGEVNFQYIPPYLVQQIYANRDINNGNSGNFNGEFFNSFDNGSGAGSTGSSGSATGNGGNTGSNLDFSAFFNNYPLHMAFAEGNLESAISIINQKGLGCIMERVEGQLCLDLSVKYQRHEFNQKIVAFLKRAIKTELENAGFPFEQSSTKAEQTSLVSALDSLNLNEKEIPYCPFFEYEGKQLVEWMKETNSIPEKTINTISKKKLSGKNILDMGKAQLVELGLTSGQALRLINLARKECTKQNIQQTHFSKDMLKPVDLLELERLTEGAKSNLQNCLDKIRRLKAPIPLEYHETLALDLISKDRFIAKYFKKTFEKKTTMKTQQQMVSQDSTFLKIKVALYDTSLTQGDKTDSPSEICVGIIVGPYFIEWRNDFAVVRSENILENVVAFDITIVYTIEKVFSVVENIAKACCEWNSTRLFDKKSCNSIHFVSSLIDILGLKDEYIEVFGDSLTSSYLKNMLQKGDNGFKISLKDSLENLFTNNKKDLVFKTMKELHQFYETVNTNSPTYFESMQGKCDLKLLNLFENSLFSKMPQRKQQTTSEKKIFEFKPLQIQPGIDYNLNKLTL